MQLFALFLASVATSVYAADPLIINTPAEVIQCGTTEITWTGGTPPYDLVIKDNGDIIGDNDLIFGTSYEFGGAAAPAGTTILFIVSDFAGQQASTAPIVVSNSSDSSCFLHSK